MTRHRRLLLEPLEARLALAFYVDADPGQVFESDPDYVAHIVFYRATDDQTPIDISQAVTITYELAEG